MATRRKPRPRPVYFETTIPVIRPCSRCGVWLAAGVAEGVKAQAQLVVLNELEIVYAVMNRIEMYALRRTGLVHMDRSRLEGRNLGYLYPQHYCNVQWSPKPATHLPDPNSNIPPY